MSLQPLACWLDVYFKTHARDLEVTASITLILDDQLLRYFLFLPHLDSPCHSREISPSLASQVVRPSLGFPAPHPSNHSILILQDSPFIFGAVVNMSTNSTSSSSGASSNDNLTLDLTVAALVISLIALVLSTLQAVLAYLQFDNSEVGRRRCTAEIMGEQWASKTTRRYKWDEYRYQVFFQAPYFYTAPPG